MGYSSLLSGNNDPNGNGDLHEGFEFGWEPKSSSSNILSNGPKRVGNVWPETLPKFRDAALDYYHAAVQLGKSLFPLFALALDLPEDFFDDKVNIYLCFYRGGRNVFYRRATPLRSCACYTIRHNLGLWTIVSSGLVRIPSTSVRPQSLLFSAKDTRSWEVWTLSLVIACA